MSDFQIDGREVLRIARAVARRFKQRCWWADVDDLVGEASLAVLKARTTFDEQVGVPFDGYAARAAALQVTDYLWRQSSPLSGGLHDPERHVAGVYRAPLEVTAEDGGTRENPEIDGEPADVADRLDEVAWRLRVRDQLRALAERTKDGDLAVEVLVHDRPSGEVAREAGRDVYRVVSLVRRKVRGDATLYDLWHRGPGGA